MTFLNNNVNADRLFIKDDFGRAPRIMPAPDSNGEKQATVLN
jgi:hypothetical protein